MFAKIGSYLAGPIIWLIGYGVMVAITVALGNLSPDNYISMGFIAYISAVMATYFALGAMSKIHPSISDVGSYLVVATFALIWVGSSVVDAKYFGRDDVFVYRLVSLIVSQVGIFTAWRIRLNVA